MDSQGRSRLIIGGLALAAVVLVISLLLTQGRNASLPLAMESPLTTTALVTGAAGTRGNTESPLIASSSSSSSSSSSHSSSPLSTPDVASNASTVTETTPLTQTDSATAALIGPETITATETVSESLDPDTPIFDYEVIETYPHDPDAFTQGLQYVNGELYEGTGLLGRSSLRRVELATGEVLQQIELADQYFGEGIVVIDDLIYQLTWQSHVAFLYDRESFEVIDEFSYPTEGWGLTYDGEELIMSDGSPNLYRRDPETFDEVGRVVVRDGNAPVNFLNELEYIEGEVWANIWQTDEIVIIDPITGQVTARVDFSGLLPPDEQAEADVLNGIAYDAENDRIFVTGKFWPTLFEVELVPR
jgi:glutaminyl-peptide cyclotransferase